MHKESHTATWSEAFPISNVGNLLSPDELCITITLQTGAKIFESTKCRYGQNCCELGLYGHSCIKNTGRFPRHSAINSILGRSLTCINLPSTLEPVGLTGDRRRPDGLTLGPWYRGLSLVWDATIVDTCLGPLQSWQCQTDRLFSNKGRGCKMPKIPWPPKQLPLSTSCNWDHWCVWQIHRPFFKWLCKETCWYVWWPQGVLVAPPAPVPGCGQR